MTKHIDFYFEFSSPYGYLASLWIDDFAANNDAEVTWHPFLMGAVFQRNDMKPLTTIPIKGDYAIHDLKRTTRRDGVNLVMPKPFPFMAVAACRAFYTIHSKDEGKAVTFAKGLYDAAFAQGKDISTGDAVCVLASEMGHDGTALRELIATPDAKAQLFAATEEAVDRGVFGSPFFFIEDEPFWGNEKHDDMQKWLEQGGW